MLTVFDKAAVTAFICLIHGEKSMNLCLFISLNTMATNKETPMGTFTERFFFSNVRLV